MDQDLLDRLVTKDLEPSSPEAQAAFAEDIELLEAYASLDELQATLDDDAAEEREVMALLDADAAAERDALARRPSRRGWLVPASMAAAAALAFFLLAPLFKTPAPTPPAPLYLGAGELPIEPLAPIGPSASFERFSIRADAATGSLFVLSVFAADAPPSAEPLLEQTLSIDGLTRGTITWKPTASDLAKLPRAIRWRVEAFDLEGQFVGAAREIFATR